MSVSYARYIGRVSAARNPSLIREMTKRLASAPEDVIPLSGGLPNPAMFPFVDASVTAYDGTKIQLAVMSGLLPHGTFGHLPGQKV